MSDDQPFVDHWPMLDEPLSKVRAPLDIERARLRLARKFNTRPIPAKRLRAKAQRHELPATKPLKV